MTNNYEIRRALVEEAAALTALSLASKKYWDYPESYFDVWLQELEMTPALIGTNDVFVYVENGTVSGYYSLVILDSDAAVGGVVIPAGAWLEHMFVAPERIGMRVGSRMFRHLHAFCVEKGITEVGILADPHAVGFYEKMGCTYVKEYPSTIAGRTTPYLRYEMDRTLHNGGEL